jgi:hypothetical protein
VAVLVLCSTAYGFALARAGVRWAARQAEGRLAEFCH